MTKEGYKKFVMASNMVCLECMTGACDECPVTEICL